MSDINEERVQYFTFRFRLYNKAQPWLKTENLSDLLAPIAVTYEDIPITVKMVYTDFYMNGLKVTDRTLREEAYQIAKREFDAKYNNKAKGSPD